MAGRRKKGGSVLYSYDDERKYAGRAVASVVLALLSVFMLGLLTGLSVFFQSTSGGISGSWIGALGVAGFTLAFIGMLEGFMSFRDECRSYALSKAGTAFCAVMVAAWFLIFCFGLAA